MRTDESAHLIDNGKKYGGSVPPKRATGGAVKFPESTAPFAEKLTNEYGIAIAELIASHWFGNGGRIEAGCNFYNRREYVRRKRLDLIGKGDVSYYKDNFKQGDNDLDFINIDWRNLNWGGKFQWIVINGISDKNYKITAKSTNRLALIEREKQRDYYLKYMKSRAMLEKAMKLQGINLMPNGIPEDEEELDIKMKTNNRSSIEIGEELMIDYVLNTNNWDFINQRTNIDNVNCGLMVARVWLDKNDGIKVAYTDIENYVHSRVDSNDFSKKYYEGVVETITLSDFIRESGCDFETARKVAKQAGPKPGINYDTCSYDDIVDQLIHVLRFAYKTAKTIKYAKNTRKNAVIKMSKKDDTYDGKNQSSKTLDTWLEGNFVVGTKYIYDYKECENLHDDMMNKCRSPYITVAHGIYDNELTAFSDNIEGPAAQLQKISLKIQQLVNKMKPDPIEIDLDMLAELDFGTGGAKEDLVKNALSIYNTEGVIFKSRVNAGEKGIMDGPAFSSVRVEQGSGLERLINVWGQYYNMIRENTGINPARDGSVQNDTLVGLNQMAQLASNTVTKNIVDNAVMFKKQVCETISSRLHAIFRYKDAAHLRKLYEGVVGKDFLDAVEVMKDRHLHEFGFYLDTVPTQEVIAELKEDLAIGLQNGTIDVQIKSQALELARSNVKLAHEYISYQIKKSIERNHKMKIAEFQEKAKADMASTTTAKKEEAKLVMLEANLEVKKEMAKSRIRIAEKEAMLLLEAPVKEREFREDVFLAKVKAASDLGVKEYLEDRKDERTDKQATQQSKILKQRNSDGQPIDFENEGNWMLQ